MGQDKERRNRVLENVKVGDVVHGYGCRHDIDCLIVVEKINRIFDGTLFSITGTVVGESGKISTTKETILYRDQRRDANIDYSTPDQDLSAYARMPITKKGGWVIIPDFEILDKGRTLAAMIRDLDIGDEISVNKEDHSVNSCRTSASLVGDLNGNIYAVSKTGTGCTITRKA